MVRLLKIASATMALLLCVGICVAGNVPNDKKATVFNGIDVLKRDGFNLLQGKKVALLTNQTGRDKNGNPTIDLLFDAPGFDLVALFAPEHGIRGELDQSVIEDDKDTRTGLPIYSLYGKNRAPKAEQLVGVDTVVFDIQDIGCRFYTYISTMANTMEAIGQLAPEIDFVVLDRINPINGRDVEGPVEVEKKTFVGIHNIAIRHGMTIGELALMLNDECGYGVKLKIVQVEGWKRSMWQDETDLPWINTSPNMRSLWEATLYPGIGVLEVTPISVGRGTTIPFELIGAPYIDAQKLVDRFRSYHIPYITVTPFEYTPNSSVHKDKLCKGVRFNVLDRDRVKMLDVGVALAQILVTDYPVDYSLKNFGTLMLHPATKEAIINGETLDEIHILWDKELKKFKKRRAKYLLYK